MTHEELIKAILAFCQRTGDIESASRIDGEPVIGIELSDGAEYFITIEPA